MQTRPKKTVALSMDVNAHIRAWRRRRHMEKAKSMNTNQTKITAASKTRKATRMFHGKGRKIADQKQVERKSKIRRNMPQLGDDASQKQRLLE